MRFKENVIRLLGVNREALRFLSWFVLIFGGCYFVFGLAPGVRLQIIKPFTEFLAKSVAGIVGLTGARAWVDGTAVRSPGYSINIAMGCDGIEASSLFLASVMAFPTSWRAKLTGVGIGIPVIQVINLARLVASITQVCTCRHLLKDFMSTLHKQLSSSSQQGSLFSGSTDLLLRIGEHKWTRLLLLAPVLYVALLPVWFLALDALAVFAATSAQLIYHFFDPLLAISSDRANVKVFVTATSQSGFGGQVHSSGLRIDTVTYGLPMLVALVIVTRADSIVAKARALVAGLLVMLVISVPVVMIWAKLTSLELDDLLARSTMNGGGNQSPFLYYAFHGYAFSQPVVAVGVWFALLMFGLFRVII